MTPHVAVVATLFFIFISLGILRSTWEFLEHNLGNTRKVEWQHTVDVGNVNNGGSEVKFSIVHVMMCL